MEMSLGAGDIVLVDEKDKAYINRSGKDGCVIVRKIVIAERANWPPRDVEGREATF